MTNINVEPIELLPEVTKQRKNNLVELVIEDGWIVNIEELLQESDKEYEPKEDENRSDSDDEDEIEK